MQNELRKNPRFVSTEGIPAKIHMEHKTLPGTILNFSSTGFAIIVSEDISKTDQILIDVAFSPAEQQPELKLSARITNKQDLKPGQIRLGCHITDMNNQSKEYFVFLTGILGKQGFLRSMATKPKKSVVQV